MRHHVNRADSQFELYNLSSDLAEQHDVADDHPEIVRRLTEIAAAAHTTSQAFPLLPGEAQKKSALKVVEPAE